MKIGIIIHSQTGNTYSVAQKLMEKLSAKGHTVNLERLEPVGEVHPGVKNLQLKSLPDVTAYDALVFAAPVQGFSLSVALATYLTQLSSLQGKKLAGFVTMAFPYSWLGGNRTIDQMKQFCETKGGAIIGTGIINWMSKRRETQISELVERLSGLF
jgi:menaquinone-dependent protoporphyrinogen IX oxidase